MSVLEHYFGKKAAWDCGQSWIRHFITQLSSTPQSRCQPADAQTVEKGFWIKAACWRNSMRAPSRRKPLVYQGELNPKTAAWSLWAHVSTDSSQTEGFTCTGKWWDGGHVFSTPPPIMTTLLLSYKVRSSFPTFCRWAGHTKTVWLATRTWCSAMLKAEKYHVQIFMHEGKSLILKECIITQNNWSIHAGNMGLIGSELGKGNWKWLLLSWCWYFLLKDLAKQTKKAKVITVFCYHPNDLKCFEEIASKHFTQSICGTGLKNYR